MSKNRLTAVATKAEHLHHTRSGRTVRIREAYTVSYETFKVRKQPRQLSPVIIIPSQEHESVFVGARNRRHRAKIGLRRITTGAQLRALSA